MESTQDDSPTPLVRLSFLFSRSPFVTLSFHRDLSSCSPDNSNHTLRGLRDSLPASETTGQAPSSPWGPVLSPGLQAGGLVLQSGAHAFPVPAGPVGSWAAGLTLSKGPGV